MSATTDLWRQGDADQWIENRTFDELQVGQSAQLLRTLRLEDIQAFAAVSGDTNPAHLNAEYASQTLFHGVIAHGMWGGALISALLGTQFPGPGTIYLDQELHFSKPVRIGDTLTVVAIVASKDAERKRVTLDCQVLNQRGERVLHGVARVLAPTDKLRLPRIQAPRLQLFDPMARFRELLALGDGMAAARCAVVHPCDAESLAGTLEATRLGLMDPVLVGPESRLRGLAESEDMDLHGVSFEDVPHGGIGRGAGAVAGQPGRCRTAEGGAGGSGAAHRASAVAPVPLRRTALQQGLVHHRCGGSPASGSGNQGRHRAQCH
jgi:phosphate acetyltransferase